MFICENLSNDNICDTIKFATNLSLMPLLSKAEKYLCKNLHDVSKTSSYQSLDSQYLLNLFSDENLILYDKGRLLPSVPREKLVLTAVLRYMCGTPALDETLISTMIKTVRLPIIPKKEAESIIKTFERFENQHQIKDYLKRAEKAALLMKEGKRPSQIDTEDVPISWFYPRKLGAFTFSLGDRRYACGGEVGWCPFPPTFYHQEPDKEISEIELWIRQWDGVPVIGGLRISYRNMYAANTSTIQYNKGDMLDVWERYEVTLQPYEKIMCVFVRSGFMIDSLGFRTSSNRTFGPYGGSGGRQFTECAPTGDLVYLHNIACEDVLTQGAKGIHNLMLNWISFN